MELLEIEDILAEHPESDLAMTELVENGMPTESLHVLRAHGLTFTEVSEIVIAPRTLKHRKSRGENLSDEETDRVIRVGRTLALANDVFGNHEKALQWLRTPSDQIGGRTPLSLLRTDVGGRVVERRLWQIDEGMFA